MSDSGNRSARERQDAPMIVMHPVNVNGPSDQADDVDALDAWMGEKYDIEVADTPEDIEVAEDE